MILATLIRAAIVISIFVLPPMAGCRKPFKELALGETFWPTVGATHRRIGADLGRQIARRAPGRKPRNADANAPTPL
jgi:hypothetical protein